MTIQISFDEGKFDVYHTTDEVLRKYLINDKRRPGLHPQKTMFKFNVFVHKFNLEKAT